METDTTQKCGSWIMIEEPLEAAAENTQPTIENNSQNDWQEYFPDFSI
ncbi:MAG TPA: hypothetical protein VK528_00920 [Flavobacterium sp.]|nr:hypothetical protein [Flavobacterium sp.]